MHRKSNESLRTDREAHLQMCCRARSLSPSKHRISINYEEQYQKVSELQQLRQQIVETSRWFGTALNNIILYSVILFTKSDVLPQNSWSTKKRGSMSIWHWASIAWLQSSPQGGKSRDCTCTRQTPWEDRTGEETTTAASSLTGSEGQWHLIILKLQRIKNDQPLLFWNCFA